MPLNGRLQLHVPGHEARVAALERDQLVVRATLDDLAAVEDDDLVGVSDGREAVGDRDRRAALGQPVERLLYGALGLGVERARRLVEDQDGRVAQDRAGDRDALLLAAGEAVAALADYRVVAVGDARAHVMDTLRARRAVV